MLLVAAALTACGGSTEPTVVGPPRRLGLVTAPAGASVGVALAMQPVVQIQDQYGRLVDTATAVVTVTLASKPTANGGGSINGETTVRAVGGIARFTDLRITGVQGNYTLQFSSGFLTTAVASPLALACGASPAAVELFVQPYAGTSGVALAPTIQLRLRDQCGGLYGNAGTWDVTAVLSSGTGTLAGTTTTHGINAATFSNLVINGSGPARVRFTFTHPTQGLSASVESATIQVSP